MGVPQPVYDPEEEQRLSAQKRAEQRWGMSPEEDTTSDGQGEDEPSSARDKANKKWGMGDDNEQNGQKTSQAEADADETSGNESATSDDEKGLLKRSVARAKDKSGYNVNLEKKKNNKKKYLAGGIFMSLAISAVGVAAFLPKIMTNIIIDQLTDTFLGRAKYAIRERAEVYTGRYLTQVIGGELRGTCGATVNRSCVQSGTFLGALTEQWKTNRIEEKLFRKYGLEFEIDSNPLNETGIRVMQNGQPLDGDGNYGSRSVSKKVFKAINTETKFESIVTRRHIKSVLVAKYGAKRFCIIACTQRDNAEARRLKALTRLKLKIYAKVGEVGLSRTSAYLLCLSINCSAADLRQSQNQAIESILSRQSDDFIAELAEDINSLSPGQRKVSNLIIQRTFEKLFNQILEQSVAKLTAQSAAKAVPVAGQIYLAATIIEFIENSKDKLQNGDLSKFMRGVNEQEAALYATEILNVRDDNQSGQASFEDQWATFQLLNGFAESRLWQASTGDEPRSTVSCADDIILSGPSDPLVCPEMQIQPGPYYAEQVYGHPAVVAIDNLANPYSRCIVPPFSTPFGCGSVRTVVRPTLSVVNSVLGFAGNTVFRLATLITPGLEEFTELVTTFAANTLGPVLSWASESLLERVIDSEAEDQLALDQTGMGLDVLGKQFAKGDRDIPDASSIEGQLLSPTQQATLDLAIREEKREEKQDMGIFARYFDVNNTDSVTASLALATASNLPVDGQPLSLPEVTPGDYLETYAAALGLTEKTNALSVQDRFELFGISQYGYDITSAEFNSNPEQLTEQACQLYSEARNASEYEDEFTGELEYTRSNICAVDEIVIDSLTKIYSLDPVGTTFGGTTTGPVTGGSGELIQLGGYILPDVEVNGTISRCSGTYLAGTRQVAEYVQDRWGKSWSGYECRPRSTNPNLLSIHGAGRAVDQFYNAFDVTELREGNETFGWLLANAESIGVQYVKFWKLQWSPSRGLRCVTDASDIQVHSNHIHYEVNDAAGAQQTPWFTSPTDFTPFTIDQDLC